MPSVPETALETSPRTADTDTTFIAPPVEFWPKSAPWGPRISFDSLNVEQVGLKRKRRGHVDAIQMEGDRGIRDRILIRLISDSPNGDHRPKSLIFCDIHAGSQCV